MVDVFISYKQEEREAVQIIADALNDLKVVVWFDTKLRAGGSFDEEIAQALQSAKAVLVCWTPAAIGSEWVRGEATVGHQSDRLAACFLQPTTLIPPFNLTHAEDLCAWAGQDDDPKWIRLLERLGELIGRPGLSTYANVMRPDAPAAELRAWADANGADPLVDRIWERLNLIEGEAGAQRNERERSEARIRDERRKALQERSRRLIRERGLRDPVAERRRMRMLTAGVIAVAVIGFAAIGYFVDNQRRDRELSDQVATITEARAFLSRNAWHPIAARARERIARMDVAEWNEVQGEPTIAALQRYLADAEGDPRGAFVAEAEQRLATAQETKTVQEELARLLIYKGPINGARDEATQQAIGAFQFRWNMRVTGEIDDALKQKLRLAIQLWIAPRVRDLHQIAPGEPTDADFIRLSSQLGVEPATLMAIAEVESGGRGGFEPDGRPRLLFEPHLFSRRTEHVYDETHPSLSSRGWRRELYPSTQEGRWQQFAAAYELDPRAALASTSFGKYQMLGQNFQALGYETAGELVRVMAQSETAQLEALVRFIRANGLVDELQRLDWEGFARVYNGPAYGQSQYNTRLAQAHRRMRQAIADRYDTLLPAVTTVQNALETPPPAASDAGASINDEIELPPGGLPNYSQLLLAMIGATTGAGAIAAAIWRWRRAF